MQSSFLSIPSLDRDFLPWEYQTTLSSPLHIVNLLRKIFMNQLGVYKLQIVQFESSDPFIVREFIETRILQLPINQEFVDDEYVIDVKNEISQEMCITTDHIRWVPPTDKSQSARKSRKLCGYAHIAKLDTGKQLFIKMKKTTNTPVYHDCFRAGTFIATQVQSDQKEDKLVFSHTRDQSICKILMFASISKEMFKKGAYCSTALSRLIENNIGTIQVIVKGYELLLSLGTFPEFITDPVLCELISDFRQNFKQIIPKGTNITLVSDRQLNEEDSKHYSDLLKQTINDLLRKLTTAEKMLVEHI